MSFSGNLRAELARIIPSGRQARETAAAALLINIGELVPGENGESRAAFNEKENLHMEDVRGLIRLLSAIRLGTGAVFLGLAAFLYLKRGRNGRALFRSAALGAGLWLMLGAAIALPLSAC